MLDLTNEQIIMLNAHRDAQLEFIQQLKELKEVVLLSPDQVVNCIDLMIDHMMDQLGY